MRGFLQTLDPDTGTSRAIECEDIDDFLETYEIQVRELGATVSASQSSSQSASQSLRHSVTQATQAIPLVHSGR
jgi:hypothetical protein